MPVTAATSRQMSAASASRGVSSSRSAPLMVTDSRSWKANSHSTVPLMTPMIGGQPAGGAMRKCALTMARNSVGSFQIGTASRGDRRRNGKNDGVVRPKLHAVVAEIERRDARRRRTTMRAADVPNASVRPLACKIAPAPDRRRRCSVRSRAISGRQARPPRQQCFAHDCGGEPRPSASCGSVLSAASRSGCHRRVIEPWSCCR